MKFLINQEMHHMETSSGRINQSDVTVLSIALEDISYYKATLKINKDDAHIIFEIIPDGLNDEYKYKKITCFQKAITKAMNYMRCGNVWYTTVNQMVTVTQPSRTPWAVFYKEIWPKHTGP
jgi:hypothetical protein